MLVESYDILYRQTHKHQIPFFHEIVEVIPDSSNPFFLHRV